MLRRVHIPSCLSLAVLVAMATAPTPARADLGTLVPAYIYPSYLGSDWSKLDAAAQTIRVTAIFNPGSGPGPSDNSDYDAALKSFESTPYGKAIGYVHTSYGARPLIAVKKDITDYIAFYGANSAHGNLIDGFFIDEASSKPGDVSYYEQLYSFIKALNPNYLVVTNQGAVPDSVYLTNHTADTIVTFENAASAYNGGTTIPGYSPGKFANIIHDQYTKFGMETNIRQAEKDGVGYVYVTSLSEPNPYNALPSYWDQEVATIEALNAVPEPSSTTIVVVCGLLGAARFVPWRRGRGRTGG